MDNYEFVIWIPFLDILFTSTKKLNRTEFLIKGAQPFTASTLKARGAYRFIFRGRLLVLRGRWRLAIEAVLDTWPNKNVRGWETRSRKLRWLSAVCFCRAGLLMGGWVSECTPAAREAQCNNSVGDSVVLARLIFLANARVFGIDMTSLYMLMIR